MTETLVETFVRMDREIRQKDSERLGRMNQIKQAYIDDSEDESETESFQKLLYADAPIRRTYFGPVVNLIAPEVTVWTDLAPGKRPCYILKRMLDYGELDRLGKETFNNLRKVVSRKDVGNLMLLAYNLTDGNDIGLFGDVPAELIDVSAIYDFDEMDDKPLRKGRSRFSFQALSSDDSDYVVRMRAIGYCYLAAAFLRLYTKSAENFTFIGDDLKKKFQNLYPFPFPFRSFNPDKETVITVKYVLENNEILKNTFYNLLYAGEIIKIGRNIKDFLYSIHVSYTGLHAYQLFVKCMLAYKVSNDQLSEALATKYFRNELEAISFVFTNLYGNKPGREAQMWRFARVFNSNYLMPLQTRYCLVFVITLAHLYKKGSTKADSGSVLNIEQIKQASKDDRILGQLLAKRARFLLHRIIDAEFQTELRHKKKKKKLGGQ